MDKTQGVKKKYSNYILIGLSLIWLLAVSYKSTNDPLPDFSFSIGEYGDYNAYYMNNYNKYWFGSFILDGYSYNQYFATPLPNWIGYVVFAVFGMGFKQIALISIFSGFIMLLFLYLILKKDYNVTVALVTLGLLITNFIFIMYNKLRLTDIICLGPIMIGLSLISLNDKKRKWFFLPLSAFFFFLAYQGKEFSLYAVVSVILTLFIRAVLKRFGRDEIRDLSVFTAVFILLAVLWKMTFIKSFSPWAQMYVDYRFQQGGLGRIMIFNKDFLVNLKGCFLNAWHILNNPLVDKIPYFFMLSVISSLFMLVSRIREKFEKVPFIELFTYVFILFYSLYLIFILDHHPPRRYLYLIPFMTIMISLALYRIFKDKSVSEKLSRRKDLFFLAAGIGFFLIPWTVSNKIGQTPGTLLYSLLDLFQAVFFFLDKDLRLLFSVVFSSFVINALLVFLTGLILHVVRIRDHRNKLIVIFSFLLFFSLINNFSLYWKWAGESKCGVYDQCKKMAEHVKPGQAIYGDINFVFEMKKVKLYQWINTSVPRPYYVVTNRSFFNENKVDFLLIQQSSTELVKLVNGFFPASLYDLKIVDTVGIPERNYLLYLVKVDKK
ncbi:MAG: glycosyltransferase family 39 protein [bacterium]|nr:glycosyltransferase family 39 protein [bacterium]